ncbi:MAG: PHP domain-containing protein [Thermoanaerobaculia bacterium]|nr:PHP domain-containing protein [Thermoanaerobaculia bacterium]
MSAVPPVPPAPAVTNTRVAAALLALAAAEEPGGRASKEYRAAARTLRNLRADLHGRRFALASLPDVTHRAADAIGAFLASGSDENVGDALAAMLDRADPAAGRKADFLSQADVDRILSAPGGLSRADLCADLHLHTDRSDGRMPLPRLHRALENRGDRYALLTDHARDCAVAGGLFPGDFRAQRREVDALNARAETFTMFVGAEANIAEDGTLDVTPRSVPEIEAVVASVHTGLRSPRDQTGRLVRAIETPGVAVLGHPKGRLYDMRSGIRADWPRVFAAAAARGVAIELNGCPERLDLPPALARVAADSGCLFSLSSDAHAAAHLSFLDFGLAVARLAGIPSSRVVNAFSRDRFAAWLEERRSGGAITERT